MALTGKGYFIWRIPDCEQGNINTIADLAVQANLTHILVKIANGVISSNVDAKTQQDYVPPLAQALKARNIQVWGWHYVYGEDPAREASKAIERVKTLNLDGYVIDAESEYKAPGKYRAARTFMSALRVGLPATPIALSSYRYPSYHPQLPWKDFLAKCDLVMPQVYWLQAHNAGDQLKRSVQEYQAMTPSRPIIPTGAAFKEGKWMAASAEVDDFLDAALTLKLEAVNFWEWANTRFYLPDVWKLIGSYDWPGTSATKDIVQQYIDALNTHDLDQVMNLYHPLAVHVDAKQTIAGPKAIRDWYSSFFSQVLPEAKFKLASFNSGGNSRYLSWTADATKRHVQNGSDTLGLAEGKIAYHYTFFTLS